MTPCTLRAARIDEAPKLTALCANAARAYGYDDETIRRFEPALSVNLALIASGLTVVAENDRAEPIGVMAVRPVGLGGLILMDRIFVDPVVQQQGVGRRLFAAAIESAASMGGSAILIYAHPRAADFYERLGCIRIGETPFYLAQDLTMPMMVYSISIPTRSDRSAFRPKPEADPEP